MEARTNKNMDSKNHDMLKEILRIVNKHEKDIGKILEIVSKMFETVTLSGDEAKCTLAEIMLRVESVLICETKHPQKKPITKEKRLKNETKEVLTAKYNGKMPANTMYWWILMYERDDPSIKQWYTEADVKAATNKVTNDVKDKPNNTVSRKNGQVPYGRVSLLQKRKESLKPRMKIEKNRTNLKLKT